MNDIELILRHFALQDEAIWREETGRISLKKHLNTFMGKMEHNPQEYFEKIEEEFGKVTRYLFKIFGDHAFRKTYSSEIGDGFKKMFHPTIFDSISIATLWALRKNRLNYDKDAMRQRKDNLLNDKLYEEYISVQTTRNEKIQGRINKAYEYLYED